MYKYYNSILWNFFIMYERGKNINNNSVERKRSDRKNVENNNSVTFQ
jgi:hypothetical protein